MRKILALTGYRSDYTKLKNVLFEINNCPTLELEVVVFGSHTLGAYGKTIDIIKEDGFNIVSTLCTNIEGDNTIAMSKTIGLSVIEISSILDNIKPDIVLICGDRYESLAAAVATSINNIPLAHIQGGEVSGTIDEVIRHSITKLSHIHFPSTELSKKRIVQMGENPNFVFNVGCPAIDFIKKQKYLSKLEMKNDVFFNSLNFDEDYLILLQHPVTTLSEDFNETLEAIQKVGIQTIMIYPNSDAGGEKIVRAERKFSNKYKDSSVIVDKYKNLDFYQYLNLLKNCSCLVGNSSSGIREAYVFGIPVVNIGSRQNGRERSSNVVDVLCDKNEIKNAILSYKGRSYNSDDLYGDGTASKQIVDILFDIDLAKSLDKRFYIK